MTMRKPPLQNRKVINIKTFPSSKELDSYLKIAQSAVDKNMFETSVSFLPGKMILSWYEYSDPSPTQTMTEYGYAN